MRRLVWQVMAIVFAASTLTLSGQAATNRQVDDIRETLLRLPYYGVFDALSFSYEKGPRSGHFFTPSTPGC